MDLGDKIRHFRMAKGYSQEDIAEFLQISRNSYMKIESGNTKNAYEKLDKIAEILKVDKWEILSHKEKEVVYVHTNNQGHVANSGTVTQNIATDKDLTEKCKNLEIQVAVLEERLCSKDKEIELLQKLLEGKV